MNPINKDDVIVIRTREHIRMKVEQLRSKGKTDEEIIHWIKSVLSIEIGLYNYFDTVDELANYVKLPVSKFNIVWM